MKIIAKTMVVAAQDGNAPCRFELIERDHHYTVRMACWDSDEWVACVPCRWISSGKSDEQLFQGHKLLRESITDKVRGLLACAYEFSVTK